MTVQKIVDIGKEVFKAHQIYRESRKKIAQNQSLFTALQARAVNLDMLDHDYQKRSEQVRTWRKNSQEHIELQKKSLGIMRGKFLSGEKVWQDAETVICEDGTVQLIKTEYGYFWQIRGQDSDSYYESSAWFLYPTSVAHDSPYEIGVPLTELLFGIL